jgi:threonine/homoserine/homoserine lactone efflux protein
MNEILLFLSKLLLIIGTIMVVFGVVLLFAKDDSRIAGYKSVIKFCLGAVCAILCILWLIQLFWGGGWKGMHLLFFVICALVAAWCFVSLWRKKEESKNE